MNLLSEELLLILGFVLIFVGIFILMAFIQNKKTNSLIRWVKPEHLDKVDVVYTKSSQTKTMTRKAKFYFNDFFIMLIPKSTFFLSIYKPIVISCKSDLFKGSNEIPKIIKPSKIKITDWNSLNIEYDAKEIIKFKIIINIKFKNNSDIQRIRINKLQNWC
jgi:uncharacterized membrane protein